MLNILVIFGADPFVVEFHPLVLAVKGVAHVMTTGGVDADVLDYREQAVLPLLALGGGPLEDT